MWYWAFKNLSDAGEWKS